MNLTPEEIERYAPYHKFKMFQIGFDDHNAGERWDHAFTQDSAEGQAYDRGAECAMRRLRIRQSVSQLLRQERECDERNGQS
jgi:hypothetical protein